MIPGVLALEQAPPFSVPLRFFLTAPLFAVGGGLLLLWEGPGALAHRWTPGLLAATHAFTLGFLAMVMCGALLQVLPVLAGVTLKRPRLFATLLHVSLTLGSLALVFGLAGTSRVLMLIAWPLLTLAFTTLLVVILFALRRARSAHATVQAIRLALVALAVTVAMGLYLLAGHAVPGVTLQRGVTDGHLSWGLLGWVGLLVVGVAYQVVPMFQITPDYPRGLRRFLAWGLFCALLIWASAQVLWPGFGWLALLPALPAAVFAVMTLHLQHQRRRRLADVTVDFWRLGMGCTLLALLLWVVGETVWSGHDGRYPLLVGVLAVVGAAVSVVSGMLYKIVPFLVWLHLNNRWQTKGGQWQGGVPNMKQVIPAGHARWHLRLHGLALVLGAVAVLSPTWASYPFALVLVVAFAVQARNLFGAAARYRASLRVNGEI